ncbi:hypothetical protein L6452_14949 [Arctium lappa]|uniref:Uncharacterized protein n=1 Tax=Arctium lappa TaxID=4217 RepID=A0ACB9CMF4_ARCLA|nr:hypothetical protein L6452_14949 [Arctium lappa]
MNTEMALNLIVASNMKFKLSEIDFISNNHQALLALPKDKPSLHPTENGLLKEILAPLQSPPQPSPSFTTEDRKTLQMVVEFGILAANAIEDLEVEVGKLKVESTYVPSYIDDDKEGEKKVDSEDPPTS